MFHALALCALATSATLFDSGEPQGPYNATGIKGAYHCSFQDRCKSWSAVELTFLDATTIDGLSLFLNPEVGGDLHLVLFDDGAAQGMPGAMVHDTFATIRANPGFPDTPGEWSSVDGLGWSIDPGSYWLAIQVEPESPFTGGWRRGAELAPEREANLGHWFRPPPDTTWDFYWKEITSEDNAYGLRLFGQSGENGAGDLNRNGVFDARDIDVMALAIQQGRTDPLYDLDQNGVLDITDWAFWLSRSTVQAGDANVDYRFDSGDLVRMFQLGQYEDGIAANSLWSGGDFNGDFEFDSSDLLLAFQAGGYEAEVAAVPEPSGAALFICGMLLIRKWGRRWIATSEC